MMSMLHVAAGAVLPLAGWAWLRGGAGAGWRGASPAGLLVDLAPAALLWMLVLAATARPILAGAVVFCLCAALAVADGAKRRVLGEPVVFSDAGLLSGVVRHPQLYLPFVGVPFVVVAVAAGGVALGLMGTSEPSGGIGTAARLVLALGALCLAWKLVVRPVRPGCLTGDPAVDSARIGPCATLACHRALAAAERAGRRARIPPLTLPPAGHDAPHLVLVQAESFFDVRRLGHAASAQPVMPCWDLLRATALAHGRFAAPAFGANTMRAEFAVLSGLGEDALGFDRFNPYFRFARAPVPSLASALSNAGYATTCLHPFDRRFFGRDRVLPALGFERFEDEGAFADAPRIGRYVADAAIASRVVEELRTAHGGRPRFLFAITMQAHGPWPGPDPFAAWLGHLRDADAMFGRIADATPTLDRPLALAVYGDHLPALPLRPADGLATDYLVWRSDRPGAGALRDLDGAGLHAAIRAALSG